MKQPLIVTNDSLLMAVVSFIEKEIALGAEGLWKSPSSDPFTYGLRVGTNAGMDKVRREIERLMEGKANE